VREGDADRPIDPGGARDAAPARSFVGGAGAVLAQTCPAGTYQPLPGQSPCLVAPVGSYVDTTGAVSATPCPAGTTTTGTGATSAAACHSPTPTKGACKKGGWRLLTDASGTPFKNQGDCVSYVATNGRNVADGGAPGKGRANKKARDKKKHAAKRSARRHAHRA
jgi:hypothetical protein